MRIASSVLLLAFLITSSCRADGYTALGSWQSHQRRTDGLEIHATNALVRITVFSASILRIEVAPTGTLAEDSSVAVVARPEPGTDWSLSESDSTLRILTARGILEITKDPIRLRLLTLWGTPLCEDDPAIGHGWDGKEVHCWKRLHEDEKFFGLGEKGGDLNRRGQSFQMWNSDIPAYSGDRDPLYASIPFVIVKRDSGSFGLFFDNTFRSTFHLGSGSRRTWSFGAEDGPLTYYCLFGPTIAEVVQTYTGLTGRMPLPPLWSLGYHQCRWSYYPEYELRDLARNFRQRAIPADALWLDIRYMDRYKVFTWDSAAFPRPASLLSDLRAQGFRVVTIIDPGIKVEPGYRVYDEGIAQGLFAVEPDGTPYEGQVWPGWCHFPDFTKASTRSWWGAHIAALRAEGVSGFWNDMNEPAVWGKEMPPSVSFGDAPHRSTIKRVHNIYAHLMAAATWQGLRARLPQERPFLITRAAFAGTQRYSAIWTGDNLASFEHMALGLRLCLGLGLSGMAFVGSDVGGFIESPSPELYARWIQLGTFTPFFRTHTVINSRDQEPWSFGEDTERMVKDYLTLRYQMLPTTYSIMRTASRTGIPAMRPLFLAYETDPRTFESTWQHEFLWGDDILVAPVLTEKQTMQKVYLPVGTWYDPQAHTLHDGPREIFVDAPWWRLPWFQRAGGCLFSRPPIQYTDQEPLRELLLDLIGGYEGESRLYLDDGNTMAYEQGDFDEITVRHLPKPSLWEIMVTSTDKRHAAEIRRLRFRVHNCPAAPTRLTWDGVEVAPGSADEGQPRVRYDNASRILEVVVPMKAGKTAVLSLSM